MRWLMGMRGALALGFGAALYFVPETGLIRLELLVAAYLLLDGALAAMAASGHGTTIAEGGLGVATAVFVAAMPGVALSRLVMVLSVWAVLAGAARLGAAARAGGGRDLALGMLAAGWGALTPLRGEAGVAAWAHWFGLYALAFGVLAFGIAVLPRRRAA